MTVIDLFYQHEGAREVQHLEIDTEQTFAGVKAILIEKHGFAADILIFLENSDDPVNESTPIREHTGPAGGKVHLHRCRHVQVHVTFNNETVHHRFGPGATIAHVKHWAAERKFDMSHEDASEHVLQIVGTHDRPPPGAHLGVLVPCPHCAIAFDLVPDQRVNGAARPGGF